MGTFAHPAPDEPGYLDLAMREYLAMRVEMNDLLRLELNLIVSALVVVGGALAAMATNVGGVDDFGRAFILQVGATFGLLVYIAALGIANAFMILEEYVTVAANEIHRLASVGERRNLGSVQHRVRTWTRSRAPRNVVAWFISYGTTPFVAAVALLAIAGLAVGGFANGTGGSTPLATWRTILGLADAVFGLVALLLLVASVAHISRWPDIMTAGEIATSEGLVAEIITERNESEPRTGGHSC
jgi:hypothetical protein